ncbi:polysaccharide pyruvyl transferase family protein [Pseudoalteromonas sp. P1-16-1b]|uniref:polysaccharide pyruvyl transferase family protein n=1 Tax=Pseudoalteromonas sp. P1-16-1b TaxID=1723757 RepID=UPI0013792F65|nr:polysaccharide pyruvyl transferase family protein [Pseudoalteromonas sp. P1-16-1b]
MKKYTIVTTYPEGGSKNIGDQLITNSLISAIKDIKENDIHFDIIWRGDTWKNVQKIIESSDTIIFACLAIRPSMASREYPFLKNILESNIPIHVVSAGTALNVDSDKIAIENYVDDESKKLLLALDEKCTTFTTRGLLTQRFCNSIGMKVSSFAGDVAFVERKYSDLKFQLNQEIKNIVISDPHYSINYISLLSETYKKLKSTFPSSNIKIALHGNNKVVKNFAIENNINFVEIYKDKDSGLRIYDDADIHVGFRVHAHVSMLKRRKYSYLFEQDGRGCDYGLTIERKISIPAYRSDTKTFISRIKAKIFPQLSFFQTGVKDNLAEQMMAIVSYDNKTGFRRFLYLEQQFNGFSLNIENQIKKIT